MSRVLRKETFGDSTFRCELLYRALRAQRLSTVSHWLGRLGCRRVIGADSTELGDPYTGTDTVRPDRRYHRDTLWRWHQN